MRETDFRQILEDIERVAAAAHELLSATRSGTGGSSTTVPSPQSAAIGEAQDTTVNAARDYLRSNPWRTLGVAAGLGFLVGCVLTGRPRHRALRK
jgi:ElaB/YqjD/DUF883 family membrane-anchored ribosome-binding protein